ncbi:hypothetical protein Y1Q_0011738 [Alligator mississippiensis]|uniref:Uncharacterized protein n=1 Tax=Alligator mississippiensis TaxID=8496 RepID=A0A151M0Y9_ALLMI|nr:hypothetical protein Y1Q_0011738 [Alligator mississippiensis]
MVSSLLVPYCGVWSQWSAEGTKPPFNVSYKSSKLLSAISRFSSSLKDVGTSPLDLTLLMWKGVQKELMQFWITFPDNFCDKIQADKILFSTTSVSQRWLARRFLM